jgi:hypothetical protein
LNFFNNYNLPKYRNINYLYYFNSLPLLYIVIKTMKAKEVIPDYMDSSDEEKVDLRKFTGAVGMGSDLSGWNDIYLKEEIKKAVREVGY